MNATRLSPGTAVYDVHGSPENPDDLGTIHSVQEGGYAVVWTGDVTPKFAADDEVAAVPADEAPSGFPPFAVRAKAGHLTAWVGSDNIVALGDHVEAIVKGKDSKRRLTIISRYRHGTGTGEDKGLVGTTAKTGLTLDDDMNDNVYGPIERRTQARPAGQSITFHLKPGIEAFAFSAYDDEGTEEDQRARYWDYDPTDTFSTRRNITRVVIDGWPGSPSRNDKIQIERWNDHGVCKDTLILFDDIWDEDN